MTLSRQAYAAHVEAVRAELEADAVVLVEDALATSGRLHASALVAGVDVPEDDDAALMWAALLDVWEAAFVRFASDTYRMTVEGKAVPNWLDLAMAWVRRHGADLVRRITETTREQIRGVVADGLAEGLGTREIARRLQEAWPDVARVRADTIGRTETLRASNAGSYEGAVQVTREMGLVMEKVWLSAKDERTRSTHRAADGQVRAMGAAFDIGGYAALYPNDPQLPAHESIRCRCTFYLQPVQTGKTISTEHMTPADVARIEQSERNARIRRDYRALRAQKVKRLPALMEIGEREGLHEDTVWDIYKGRR